MRPSVVVLAGLIAIAGSLEAQTLTVPARTTPGSGSTLSVFVDGNVKNAMGGTGNNTAVVSGALGLRYVVTLFTTLGQINIAAKTDTLASAFGTALPSSGSGKALNSGVIDVRTRTLRPASCPSTGGPPWCRLGAHGYASASTTRCATASQRQTVTATTDVPVIGRGIGGYYSFFDGRVRSDTSSSRVGMVLDATFTAGDSASIPAPAAAGVLGPGARRTTPRAIVYRSGLKERRQM